MWWKERERRCVFRLVGWPHFTEYTGWTVSNDWSPHASPWGKFADSTLTQWGPRLHSGQTVVAVRLHAAKCSLSLYLLTLCSALLLLVCPLQERRGIILASFSSPKASSAPKLVQGFPAVPGDSWPLCSSRLNCRGSDSSRKAPRWAEKAQQCLSTSDSSVSLNEESPCNVKNKQASNG